MEWLRWWMVRRSLAGAENGDDGRSTLRLLLWLRAQAKKEPGKTNGERGEGAGECGVIMACSGSEGPR